MFGYIGGLGSDSVISYRWSSDYSYRGNLVIPSKTILYAQVVQHNYMMMENSLPTMGNPFNPDKFARKVSSILVSNPTSNNVSIIDNFEIANADYNSIEQLYLLDDIHNQLVTIYNSFGSQLASIESINNSLKLQNHVDLTQIHNDLQSIIDSYNANSSTASNVVNDASSTTSTIDEVHRQEEEFYLMNQSALQEVGLNNYDIDPNTRLGYTAINSDFDKLWRSLGPWVGVYTFTLLISLASYIIRLKPWTTNHTHKDN